jgi:hypothetical protein
MKGRIRMDQCKRSAESRTLQRLPPFERGEIKALSGEGPGAPAIAAGIGRGEAAAGRETERGTARQPDGGSAERLEYFAETGGAAGRAKLEPELSGKPALCAKAPCNCIDPGIMPIKNIDLALKVRRKPKSEKARQSGRALGASVEGRPEAAWAREEFGHWEIGSASGKKSGKSAVPAIVERKARSQIAAEPDGRDSGAANAAAGRVAGSFGEAAGGAFKSAAGGNGREFAGRRRGARRLFPPSPLKLREGGQRAPQRASAPLCEKGEKRGRHARAADLQGGGLVEGSAPSISAWEEGKNPYGICCI